MGKIHSSEFTPKVVRREGHPLRIYVINTGPELTRASLRASSNLACDLDADIELLVPVVVPYPIPLDRPTVSPDLIANSASDLAQACGVNPHIHILLCRDREEAVSRALPAESVAVIGRARRWGPGSHRRLIKCLDRAGHHLIVVDRNDEARVPAAALQGRRTW